MAAPQMTAAHSCSQSFSPHIGHLPIVSLQQGVWPCGPTPFHRKQKVAWYKKGITIYSRMHPTIHCITPFFQSDCKLVLRLKTSLQQACAKPWQLKGTSSNNWRQLKPLTNHMLANHKWQQKFIYYRAIVMKQKLVKQALNLTLSLHMKWVKWSKCQACQDRRVLAPDADVKASADNATSIPPNAASDGKCSAPTPAPPELCTTWENTDSIADSVAFWGWNEGRKIFV